MYSKNKVLDRIPFEGMLLEPYFMNHSTDNYSIYHNKKSDSPDCMESLIKRGVNTMADLLCTDRDTNIFIRPTALKLLTDHMSSSLSSEVCGVLLGRKAAGGMRIESYRKLRNVAPNPLHHFLFDPIEWVQCCYQETDMIGIFHSHPSSAPIPSSTDLIQLQQFGALTPIYLIGSSTDLSDQPQWLYNTWLAISDQDHVHQDYQHTHDTQSFAVAGYQVITNNLADGTTLDAPLYTLQSSILKLV